MSHNGWMGENIRVYMNNEIIFGCENMMNSCILL